MDVDGCNLGSAAFRMHRTLLGQSTRTECFFFPQLSQTQSSGYRICWCQCVGFKILSQEAKQKIYQCIHSIQQLSVLRPKNYSNVQCCQHFYHHQSLGALRSWSFAGPVSQQPLLQRPDGSGLLFPRRRLFFCPFRFRVIGCVPLPGGAVFQPAHHHHAAGRSLRRSLKKKNTGQDIYIDSLIWLHADVSCFLYVPRVKHLLGGGVQRLKALGGVVARVVDDRRDRMKSQAGFRLKHL